MPRQKSTKSGIKVSFWGVRGSVPTHHAKNVRYGGHTACISIQFNKRWFICDAGTGIRLLGEKLAKTRAPLVIFLSHFHWDHIFGLPFFKPLYQHKRKIVLAGPSLSKTSFKKALGQIMRRPYFPIGPIHWNSNIKWLNLKPRRFLLDGVRVETKWVCHPDETLGFQFIFPNGKRVICVTDQELSSKDKKFFRWIQGADILIHDSQYNKGEYVRRKGWGHSAYEVVLEMAIKAKVKKLVFFHHDPNVIDFVLEKRLVQSRKRARKLKSSIQLLLAKEGSSIYL